MGRWVRIQADIFEHEVFARDPFSEREAWIWLISKAAWKDTKHRIGQTVAEVPAGSMFLTLREMQAAWGWRSDKRVRSFLAMLENERMVETKTDAGKTQIIICNYSRYQEAGRTEDASGTHGGRTADALKTPVHQDTNSSSLRSEEYSRDTKPDIKAEFDNEFWPAYPRKAGKPKALEAYRKARKRVSFEAIMAGVRRYAAERTDQDAQFTKFAQGWLNRDGWDDEPTPLPQARGSPKPKSNVDKFLEAVQIAEDQQNESGNSEGNWQATHQLRIVGSQH